MLALFSHGFLPLFLKRSLLAGINSTAAEDTLMLRPVLFSFANRFLQIFKQKIFPSS